MSIKVNYNNMMQRVLGEHGLTDQQLAQSADLCLHAHQVVEQNRGKGMQGWMDSPYNQQDVVARIKEVAKRIQNECETFVVLGIGGSALGPIAVFNALKHLYYNELPRSVRKAPKFYVLDNVDPERISALLDVIDLNTTIFNVITKSGATSETMSQYLVVMDMLNKKFGRKAREHVIATTSESRGNLIKLATEEGYETFYIPDGVGGRFSELCPVGLLPAAVVGIDIEEMLRGAREMDQLCQNNTSIDKNPALAMALLQHLSIKQGKNVSVMMPYADSLKYVADWYCQLWGESLGKEKDVDGNIVNVGQTPLKCLGATDQHILIQLFNEGPYDKVITFLEVANYRTDIFIPAGCDKVPDVNFLCNNTMGTLLSNELYATKYALTKRGRSNFTITLDKVDEYHIGALLYMLQMQTAYIGVMLNINAYNQPGVEGGKNAVYALFGRKGYEAFAEEMKNAPQDVDKYTV
ncbi:MAG: glucose-6-phosphate isomerase [Clostridia bacterium]|nr:glucose-6-phosphate isomerase [Clostridia bacterium]